VTDLVLIYELVTSELWTTNVEWRLTCEWIRSRVESSLILRSTDSLPVCRGIKHPSGAYDQILITVRHLRVYWCGELSLTRGRVCRLHLLLALASEVILGSESRGTRDHILLSQIRDFPFCRLLRLAGSRWRYSTPPPHGIEYVLVCMTAYTYSLQSLWKLLVACSYPWKLLLIPLTWKTHSVPSRSSRIRISVETYLYVN
jgi:hypothetical protein